MDMIIIYKVSRSSASAAVRTGLSVVHDQGLCSIVCERAGGINYSCIIRLSLA